MKLVEAPAELLRGAAYEVAASIDLAETAQLKEIIERASGVLDQDGTDVPTRVHAVRLLSLDRSLSKLKQLENALTPQQPQEVQMAAARALVDMKDARATPPLLKHWSAQTTAVRDVILTGLLQDTRRLTVLLDAIERGEIQPASVSRASRQRILRARDEGIRKRATAVFANVSSDREAIIRKFRPAASRTGDSSRGIEVFRVHCGGCHKIGDIGVQVGPDLLTLAGQPKEELLSNILDPNANIAPGYEEYLVQTRDGRTMTGVIGNQNTTSVTLRRSKGEEDTILRHAIAEMRVLTVSAMPENLEEGINVEQMADLLEYLKTAGSTKLAGR